MALNSVASSAPALRATHAMRTQTHINLVIQENILSHTHTLSDKTYYVYAFQFAVLMWLLTYVGALFNGLTLLILGEVIPAHSISFSIQLLL